MVRKKGSLNKGTIKKYQEINRLLKSKEYYSHRDISRYCKCSKSTIQKAIKYKKNK